MEKYSCCNRPSVADLDHKKYFQDNAAGYIEITSRVCLNCYTHWYGPAGNVKKYTSKEWDAWMNGL